mgnify:CR=1 FL=1
MKKSPHLYVIINDLYNGLLTFLLQQDYLTHYQQPIELGRYPTALQNNLLDNTLEKKEDTIEKYTASESINENIDIFFSEEVVHISKKTNLIELTTKRSTYLCDHIFDSRPSKNNFFMMQQFFGAYIKSKNDIFDDKSAVFMEFSNLRNKFHFNYILPFSRNSALIESTYFSSKKEYNMLNEDYINEYMKLNYRNEKYEIHQ